MGIVFALPDMEFTSGLPVFESNQGKGQAKLLSKTAPVEIDHLRPGSSVDILFSIGIDFVHWAMSVAENHSFNFWLLIEKLAGFPLQIQR